MDYTGSELQKKLTYAQSLIKKAKDATKTSFLSFRFTEDWISAARYSREAVEILRRCGQPGRSHFIEAIELMTTANKEQGHYNFCGTAQEEKGAYLSKLASDEVDSTKKTKLTDEASEAYGHAAKYFGMAGQLDRATNAFLTAAQLQRNNNNNIKKAIEYSKSACKLFENQSKMVNAEKPLRQAFVYILEAEDYEEAIGFLYFQNELLNLSRGLYANNIHKNYYSEIVILVFLNQIDRAQQALDKHNHDDPDFYQSTEYAASAALIELATNGDPLLPEATDQELINKYKQDYPVWKFLERPISLLFNKISLQSMPSDMVPTSKLGEFTDDQHESLSSADYIAKQLETDINFG